MTTSNGLQEILTASKAAIDSLKAVQKKVSGDLVALGEQQARFVADHAQGALKIMMDGLHANEKRILKNIADAELRSMKSIWAEQDKAVALINQGLAAIDEKHNASVALLQEAADFEIANIRGVADD